MRGCLQRAAKDKRGLPKGEHTWNIILSFPRAADGRYPQKWIRFHGTKKQAEERRRELTSKVYRGKFIEPTKVTVGDYLDEWLKTVIQPLRAIDTHALYSNIVRNHLKPSLGHLLLQRLNVMDVERHYAEHKLSQTTATVHHAVLTCALNAAVKKASSCREPCKPSRKQTKCEKWC